MFIEANTLRYQSNVTELKKWVTAENNNKKGILSITGRGNTLSITYISTTSIHAKNWNGFVRFFDVFNLSGTQFPDVVMTLIHHQNIVNAVPEAKNLLIQKIHKYNNHFHLL